MAEHYDDLPDVFWFFNTDNGVEFTYDIDAKELWGKGQLWGEEDTALPIGHPKTIEQARSIIESEGYTIA